MLPRYRVSNNKAFGYVSLRSATGVEPSDPNLGYLLVNDSITTGARLCSYYPAGKKNDTITEILACTRFYHLRQNEVIPTNIE